VPQIGGLVEPRASGRRGEREAELRPQTAARELEALEGLGVNRVEEDQLAAGRDHQAPRGERAVREAGVVQPRQRGQQLEQQAEPRVEAGDDAVFGGRVQYVREPASGDALRDDREAVVRAALDRARPREPLVLEPGDNRQPLVQCRFEHGQFGP
jgi:hypothetical protein